MQDLTPKSSPPPAGIGYLSEFQKLETFLREIPAAVALLRGPDFVFESANDAYCELVSRHDIVGKTLHDALPEIRDTSFPSILREVFATGNTFQAREVEVYLQSAPQAGSPSKRVFIDINYRRILGTAGEPYGIFAFVVDVTEKVEARMKIQLEQAKLESVFLNASASLAILRGPNGIYEKANASYLSLFDDRPILGRAMLDAFPELEGQKFPDLVTHVYESGEQYTEVEARAFLRRTSEGKLEERFFDQSYSRIVDNHGEPYGVLIHAIDVTDRVNSRKIFRAEKQKFESMFFGSASPLVLFRGPGMVYELYNSRYEELVPDRELKGKPLLEALPELAGTPLPELIQKVFETGKATMTLEEYTPLLNPVTNLLTDRYFDFGISRVDDGEGHPYGVIVQATEVTERVESRKKIEQALSARDTFLSIASHELKTPLTGMKLQTQMMKRALARNDERALSAERITRLVESSDEGLGRITRLVEDMLDISRIQLGKLSLHREPTDFVPFTRDLVDRFSDELAAARIEASVESRSSGIMVSVDRFRMEQVLTNLVTNAVKYAFGAPLHIRLSAGEGRMRMDFRDHGPGILPESRERVFERFERLVPADHVSGMGLGLYIVREILASHGGRIFVEAGESPGAHFVVELPLMQ